MTKHLLLAAAAAFALPVAAFAQHTPSPAALRDAALHDNLAWEITEGLTTEVGPRLAATDAEARARAWAVKKLTALGFANVHVEPFRMPLWVRGEERAEITGPFPQKLAVTALGNSGATGPKGIEAEVVYFPSFADLVAAPDGSLKGKIAFVSHAMTPTQDASSYGAFGQARFQGPNVAAKKGAAAIVIRSVGTDHHRVPHTGTTNFAPGVAPIPAAALSVPDAEQLVRIFGRGQPVRMHLVLTPQRLGEAESGNVVAEVPGTDPQAGIVLVGGHLDSWDLGTGAIDDASGLGIVTAAAKRVMQAGRPRRTIRIVWFGAEEQGGIGGKAYAEAHAKERHVVAAESDLGADRIWRVETGLAPANKPLSDRLAAALAPLGIAPGGSGDDFGTDVAPVIRLGTAGIGLSQSATRYFDWHHTADDTLDKIDMEQLRQNVAAWTATLAIVANAPEEIRPAAVTE